MSAVYHKLADGNLTQNWSDSSLIATSNDWSNVPSIQGFSTVDGASGEGLDPRTLTGNSSNLDVAASVFTSPSQYNPNLGQHGGVTEFQDFGIVGLGGGLNATAPNLVFYLDTTGVDSPIKVNFDVQDLDGSTRNSEEQLNVQYRIGETGPWTNVPSGYIADVTSPNATTTNQVSLTLPPDAMGQPELQVRIMTTNATGRDEWVGIDNIAIACFVRGTLIRTPHGEIPVETLAIGDEILTHDRGTQPVKWIGRRAFSARFVTETSPVVPVLVRANALGDGIPYRDLFISPEHALFFDGVLVPAGSLVNGHSIIRELSGDVVEYFHIEVEGQAIVLANGAPAETYVNHNNRKMFTNWQEWHMLYGEDRAVVNDDGTFKRTYACLTSGAQFAAIVAHLNDDGQSLRLAS
jgi:hypothetical protein